MDLRNVFKCHLCRRTFYYMFLVLYTSISYFCSVRAQDFRLVKYNDLQPNMDIFSQRDVKSYGQLLFDITRYQLIVGSRDYVFRLSLEGLKKFEESYWPAKDEAIEVCSLKGKSEDDCRNYVKVLLSYNGKLFSCGTNAFKPECSWRDLNQLKSVEWTDGVAKCPYRPDANTTAIMTSQGDYYIGSTFGFSGQIPSIYRILGNKTYLRTVEFDPKWLNEPNFIASYEVDSFIFFFFRETAVEYINCGKIVYSRVARVCKNDPGGRHVLKGKWTTFLKARLNCSLPGNYPFYFNEIQGIHYLEREQMIYATFSTPENSIYGSAICVYNVSSIQRAFNTPFKYQSNAKSTWERQSNTAEHFQCGVPVNDQTVLHSQDYQLMDEAVQPITSHPLYNIELGRLSHIVVDVVPTKDNENGVHVIFVATVEGVIRKLLVLPEVKKTCLIEELEVLPKGSSDRIMQLKLLKDTNSLYIGTESSVLRVSVQRCSRLKSKVECLKAMDPYCGWDEYQLACVTAPQRNPLNSYWLQERTRCPDPNRTVHGGWSPWSRWFECLQTGENVSGDTCQCQQRQCDNPSPVHGGKDCQGSSLHVTNCTRNGHWTEWSPWSSCSQTCGLAVKTRRRTCGNPSPAFGGRICIGPDKDEIYCTSNPPCPVSSAPPVNGQWSEWSTWEECSSQCGGGTQVRRRRCNSPPPQHGGQECIGCNYDSRICNVDLCPEVRKSSSWTPFLRINSTRDGYFEQRFRFTCKANVPDDGMLRLGHMKKEERFCLEGSSNCLDAAFVNIDGEWSAWSSWSQCSASCGGGTQHRMRVCDSPRPVGTGSECVGLSRMDRACNTELCPDDTMWEEWSAWSVCDQNLEQSRRRRCKLMATSQVYCNGPTKEIKLCSKTEPLPNSKASALDDGIHASHVAAAFICGMSLGAVCSAVGIYYYMKRKHKGQTTVVSTQLIPVKPNTYHEENEWKNNYTLNKGEKIPLREATIKRNGNFRAQIQSDQMF